MNSLLKELLIVGGYKKEDSLPLNKNAQIKKILKGGTEISIKVFTYIQYTVDGSPA